MSFNPSQLNYNVRNANACKLLVGDVVVAYGQAISPVWDMGTQQLYGVGSANPQEIQQLRMSPEITVNAFVLTDKGRTEFQYPSTYTEVLANNAFDVHLMDSTSTVILTYVGCVCSNYALNVPTNEPLNESISMMAMDILDSNGISLLNGNNSLSTTWMSGNLI